jgi:hypothetical protein
VGGAHRVGRICGWGSSSGQDPGVDDIERAVNDGFFAETVVSCPFDDLHLRLLPTGISRPRMLPIGCA